MIKPLHIFIGLAFGLATEAAQASVTYDLATDFSNFSNPNNTWSFLAGSTYLTHHSANVNTGNALDAVVTNGYWGGVKSGLQQQRHASHGQWQSSPNL